MVETAEQPTQPTGDQETSKEPKEKEDKKKEKRASEESLRKREDGDGEKEESGEVYDAGRRGKQKEETAKAAKEGDLEKLKFNELLQAREELQGELTDEQKEALAAIDEEVEERIAALEEEGAFEDFENNLSTVSDGVKHATGDSDPTSLQDRLDSERVMWSARLEREKEKSEKVDDKERAEIREYKFRQEWRKLNAQIGEKFPSAPKLAEYEMVTTKPEDEENEEEQPERKPKAKDDEQKKKRTRSDKKQAASPPKPDTASKADDEPDVDRSPGADVDDEPDSDGVDQRDAGGGGGDDERRRPLGTEDDPIYTQWTEDQWQNYERVLGEHAKDVAEKLGPHFDRVVKSLGSQTQTILDALGVEGTVEFVDGELTSSIEEVNGQTDNFASKMKSGVGSLKSAIEKEEREDGEYGPQLRATLEKVEAAITTLERSQKRHNQLLEEQTPEHLRLPNPERVTEKILGHEALNQIAEKRIEIAEQEDRKNLTEQELTDLLNELVENGLEKEKGNPKLGGRSMSTIRKAVESFKGDQAQIAKEIKDEVVKDLVENFLKKENRYKSKLYQQEVESWFEDRLREMETDERAFEEQGDIYRRVDLAATYFKFRDETQHLGSKLAKRMEARRIMKRQTRVSNLSTPENQMGQASSVKIEHFKELFTYRETDELNVFLEEMGMEKQDEDAVIAKEFEEYEDMGKRKQVGQLESDDIVNYYVTGGKLSEEDIQNYETWSNETTIAEAITYLKREKSKRELETREAELLSKLERELWAARTAGNLWSITHRAALYDVFDERMNGTGGFFAARVVNLADRFEGKAGYQKMKAFWDHPDPELGKLDLEFKDWFTLNGVDDLSAESLSKENLWEGDDRKMKEGYGPSQIDKFIKADLTRKAFWGKSGFLQNPTHKKWVGLGELYGHLSDKDAIESEKIGKEAQFGDPNATEVQENFAELTERLMDWMDTPVAGELVENLKIYPSAEKVAWIEDASTTEMITNEQRDRLFNRYTSVPVPFMSAKGKAYLRARLSLYVAPLRDPMMRSLLISGNISEFFKRLFSYIFSDEIR